jgi:hypothetical protein
MNIGYLCKKREIKLQDGSTRWIHLYNISLATQLALCHLNACEKIYIEPGAFDDSVTARELEYHGVERCTFKEIPQASKDVLFLAY